MKDLIDREKALDCFHDWVDKYGDVHTADEMTEYQAIETLPTEKSPCALCQYNNLKWDEEPYESCTMGGENNHFKAVERWIPCSERLPEIKEYHVSDVCIVYCENGAYGFAELEENIFGQVGWNCERDDEYHEPLGNVLAWMPLPEPYKGKE